jgi:hypothetical protein
MGILDWLFGKQKSSIVTLQTLEDAKIVKGTDIANSKPMENIKKIDLSIKRKMVWSKDVSNSKLCPQCSRELETQYQMYMLAIKERKEVVPFLTGNDAGSFCLQCPTVVLDFDKFEQLASAATRDKYNTTFAVIGVVNRDAIPEDKADVPLGDDDNPIPLVEFISESKQLPKSKPKGKRWKLKRKN